MMISRGQHRLQRIQLVNWGTFHGAFDLPVPRKGLLVTGPSGSGKSSLLDALASVLVQPKWLSFNAAAQEGGTGDRNRSLLSYVRGAYKREADETTGEVATTYRRLGATWSAIALTFDDGAGSTTSLVRLLHVARGTNAVADVNSLFVIAEEQLDVTGLARFAEDGLNARQLRAVHPDWMTFPTYQAFAARMQRRLGLASDQAQRLLHKTQSAKNLTSLDALLRDFMLDEPETFTDVERAVEQFGELSQAHALVVDARRQVEVLGPLRGIGADLATSRAASDASAAQQKHLTDVFLELRVADTAVDVARRVALVTRLQLELSRADADVEACRALESTSRRSLDGMGGAELQRIEEDTVRVVAERQARQRQRDGMRALADQVELKLPEQAHDFPAFLSSVDTLRGAVADTAEVKEAVYGLAAAYSDAARERRRLADELAALDRQRSNMDASLLAVRDLLIASGLERERLWFVGELLDVRAGHEEWRGAVERVLRSFARTLLVPADLYPHVSELIESEHLGTRLVYEKVTTGADPAGVPDDPRYLAHKVDVAENESANWVVGELNRRFDYLCVSSAAELRAITRGVTRAGQVRHSGTRHEKDDRRRIDDRTSWVLGTSAGAKREALLVALDAAEDRETAARAERDTADTARSERARKAGILDQLKAGEWERIDVADSDRELADLRRRAEALRVSHAGLAEAERQLAEAERAVHGASQLRDGALGNMQKERGILDVQQALLETWSGELAGAAEVPVDVHGRLEGRLRGAGPDLTASLQAVTTALAGEATTAAQGIARATNRAERIMSDYKRDWPGPAADWAIQIDYLPDFLERLEGLEADRLPEFEDRFFTLLQNQSRNNVGSLKQKITSSRREIRERVDPINASLRMTDYSPGQNLVVKVDDRRLPEVTLFLAELDEITAGSFEDTFGLGNDPASRVQAEERFVRMQVLMKRLGSSEPADIRWRQSCLDTRQHVRFVAEVRDHAGATVDVLAGAGGLSGGERQKLVVFCLAAALRYQLARGGAEVPTYGLVVLDEAFDKTDPAFTRAGLEVFRQFEFQLLLATPLKMLQTLEDYVGGAAVVRNTGEHGSRLEALVFDQPQGEDEPIPSDSQEALV